LPRPDQLKFTLDEKLSIPGYATGYKISDKNNEASSWVGSLLIPGGYDPSGPLPKASEFKGAQSLSVYPDNPSYMGMFCLYTASYNGGESTRGFDMLSSQKFDFDKSEGSIWKYFQTDTTPTPGRPTPPPWFGYFCNSSDVNACAFTPAQQKHVVKPENARISPF
jgi:hypothetical protein